MIHGLGPTALDVGAFKQFHAAYRNAFPDVRIQVDDVITEGEKVAGRWSGTRHHAVPAASTILPTLRSISVDPEGVGRVT